MNTVTNAQVNGGLMTAALLALGAAFIAGGVSLMKESLKEGRDPLGPEFSVIAMGFVAAGLATETLGGITGWNAATLDFRDLYKTTSKNLYRTHIDQEVQKVIQPEIVQKNTKQIKQINEMSRRQKSITK